MNYKRDQTDRRVVPQGTVLGLGFSRFVTSSVGSRCPDVVARAWCERLGEPHRKIDRLEAMPLVERVKPRGRSIPRKPKETDVGISGKRNAFVEDCGPDPMTAVALVDREIAQLRVSDTSGDKSQSNQLTARRGSCRNDTHRLLDSGRPQGLVAIKRPTCRAEVKHFSRRNRFGPCDLNDRRSTVNHNVHNGLLSFDVLTYRDEITT
jgi:hypothetical protein